jgi:acetyltransferase EpsM
MKKLIILGGSGIGMIASSIAKESGEYEVCGFLNDFIKVGTSIGKYQTIPVVGTTNDIQYYLDNDYYFFIAYVGLKKEKETFNKINKFNIPKEKYATLIHKTAIIPHGFCNIGYGVLMGPLSQISPDTTIEDNCILLGNSFLGHDSTMKKFAHLATNSVVGANVTVGRGVHVGSNSTIREKTNIGDFSLIGSGTVVLKDVKENTIVVGNPAKQI